MNSRDDRGGERYAEAREEKGMAQFRAVHDRLSTRVERFLMQAVILGLVAVVLVQTLQTFPFARRHLNLIEALEGISYNEVLAWSQETGSAAVPASGSVAKTLMVTVVLVSHRSAPEARLLVDGQPVGTFGAGSVTAAVVPGQMLSIDGSKVAEPLTFRVVGAQGLLTPALGTSVTTRGNVQSLGRVHTAD